MINLREIRELHQSTMMSPWNYGRNTRTRFPLYSQNEHFGSVEFEEEAKFICWAKNNLPALLDWVERVQLYLYGHLARVRGLKDEENDLGKLAKLLSEIEV